MNRAKINSIQKRGNLNTVYRMGEPGPGGAFHDYEIQFAQLPENDPTKGVILASVFFQKGPRKDPKAQHGVLDLDLLEIIRDRLNCFQQGEYATRENACALHHIEEALLWMNKRVEDRIERDILGTYEK
jgi:hypothetical protein